MKTFVAWLLALVVVGSPAMFGLNRPFAAELPNDTTAITSLTPEQARLVVAEALAACVLQRHPEKSARERATMLAEILANKERADVYESWAIARNESSILGGQIPRSTSTVKASALSLGERNRSAAITWLATSRQHSIATTK